MGKLTSHANLTQKSGARNAWGGNDESRGTYGSEFPHPFQFGYSGLNITGASCFKSSEVLLISLGYPSG